MAKVVVDASAAVQIASMDAGFAALAGHHLIGPTLLVSESVSAVHQMQWRSVIDPPTAEQLLRRILDAPIELRDSAGLVEQAWMLATELGWAKTYDAEYVALAELERCALLTVDARLAKAVAHRVALFNPSTP